MFKKLSHLLFAACVALLPVMAPDMARAGAKEDILAMGLYRGFDGVPFSFDTKITAYKGGKASGPAQVATILYRNSGATLVDFRAPATFAGRRILTEGANMWMSLPTSQRTIRVSADDRLMGQASNGDILNIPTEKYSYDYNGTETVDGREYTRIAAKLSGGSALYARVDFLLEPGSNKPFRSYHFSKSGKLLKIAEYQAFKNFAGHPRVTKITLIDPIATSNVTVMQFDNYAQRDLPKSMFSKAEIRSNLGY